MLLYKISFILILEINKNSVWFEGRDFGSNYQMKYVLSQLQNEISSSSIEHLGEEKEESKMKREEWMIEKLDFDHYIQDILNSSSTDTKHQEKNEKEEDFFDSSSSSFDCEWKRFAENNRQEMVASSSSPNNNTKIEKEVKEEEEDQNEMKEEEDNKEEEEERDMENEIELWGVPSFKFFLLFVYFDQYCQFYTYKICNFYFDFFLIRIGSLKLWGQDRFRIMELKIQQELKKRGLF